jgi:hypothetical protein
MSKPISHLERHLAISLILEDKSKIDPVIKRIYDEASGIVSGGLIDRGTMLEIKSEIEEFAKNSGWADINQLTQEILEKVIPDKVQIELRDIHDTTQSTLKKLSDDHAAAISVMSSKIQEKLGRSTNPWLQVTLGVVASFLTGTIIAISKVMP